MKKNSMTKLLLLIGCIVLIAAMALTITGCGGNEPAETTPAADASGVTELGDGATSFQFSVVDLDGTETKFLIHTDEKTVGAALLAENLIEGEDGPYGLYVKKVLGITAVYEEDGSYWAFYENGQYALAGVDQTEINPDTAYSFVKTKD